MHSSCQMGESHDYHELTQQPHIFTVSGSLAPLIPLALARNYPALLTKRDPLWPPLCKAFRLATPRGIRRG